MAQPLVQQVSEDDLTVSDDEDEVLPLLCTFAATGTNPSFQAIFVCLDCGSDKDGVCICRACADACHAGHDVDFVGMGPAFCDCPELGNCCRLQSASQAEAARLGIHPDVDGMKAHVVPQAGTYLQEAFTISSLQEDHVCDRLVREAIELIQHSRDTHWLDFTDSYPVKKCCKLEGLALSILHRHVHEYFGDDFHGGAEWWVQVKPVSIPGSNHLDNEAIDLHYDKDENLAELFGLGSFPTLSTITYLSLTSNASPTVVFPHTYYEDEGEVMQDMLVSYPRRGKHVAFDGRLLHGAPAHHALRQPTSKTVSQGSSVEPRVTLLVNVWPIGPPSGVKRLPTDVCQRVQQAGKRKKGLHIPSKKPAVEFQDREINCVTLETVEDIAEAVRDRIELPFVSRGATWIGKTQGTDLVVVTFPPPASYEDTIKVRFGPGLQAYLEYKVQDEKTEHPNDGDFYLEDYV
jgi:hypothetical protein